MNLRRAYNILSWIAGIAGLGLFVWLFSSTDVLGSLASLPPVLWLSTPLYFVPLSAAVFGLARSIPTASSASATRST